MTRLERSGGPAWQRALVPLGVLLSVSAHAVIALTVDLDERQPPKRDTWSVVTVAPPPPPPPEPPKPPEVEPPPEPPKPKAKPKVVDIKDTTTKPPPTPTPEVAPEPGKTVRRTAGLSASSFAKGSGTGLSADAGTTLGTAPGGPKMTIEEAASSVAYSAVTSRPVCERPALSVPEEVAKDQIEGQVRVVFDVNERGGVQRVRVTGRLHPAADAACVAAWSKARCTPGAQGGEPVLVTNMPYYCTFKAID